MICGLNPGRGNRFSLLQTVQSSGATQPPIQQLPIFFPGGKEAGGDVYHLPPYNAKVKNEWRYAYTPHIQPHGMNIENFKWFIIANNHLICL